MFVICFVRPRGCPPGRLSSIAIGRGSTCLILWGTKDVSFLGPVGLSVGYPDCWSDSLRCGSFSVDVSLQQHKMAKRQHRCLHHPDRWWQNISSWSWLWMNVHAMDKQISWRLPAGVQKRSFHGLRPKMLAMFFVFVTVQIRWASSWSKQMLGSCPIWPVRLEA